jgi:gentisate 1,2-dioxygenase
MRDPNYRRTQLYEEIAPLGLRPLWTVLDELVPSAPRPTMEPATWRYAEVRSHLMRAGDIISAEEAVRRVLILENPGAPDTASITSTLYAGLQLLLPGEVAPAHRHSQSALRFVLEGGDGAFTTVRGERLSMHAGDLILTPSFEWHDHGHEGKDPVVWLDGLDIPLIRALNVGFQENAPVRQQERAAADGMERARWGSGLRPFAPSDHSARVERFTYPFTQWRPALEQLMRGSSATPYDGHCLEFFNPVDAGPVLPTISAFCHLLPTKFQTQSQRRTDAGVYVVVEGSGCLLISGRAMEVEARDIFVVPAWTHYTIRANETLVLFSYSDRAVQQQLGLWRRELC